MDRLPLAHAKATGLAKSLLLSPEIISAAVRHFVTQSHAIVPNFFTPEKIAKALVAVKTLSQAQWRSKADDPNVSTVLRGILRRPAGVMGKDLVDLVDGVSESDIQSVLALITKDLTLYLEAVFSATARSSDQAAAASLGTSDPLTGSSGDLEKSVETEIPDTVVTLVEERYFYHLLDSIDAHRHGESSGRANHHRDHGGPDASFAGSAAALKTHLVKWDGTRSIYDSGIVATVSCLLEGPVKLDYVAVKEDQIYCLVFSNPGLGLPQTLLQRYTAYAEAEKAIDPTTRSQLWGYTVTESVLSTAAAPWPSRRKFKHIGLLRQYYSPELWTVAYLSLLADICSAMATWDDFVAARLWFYQTAHLVAYAYKESEVLLSSTTRPLYVRPMADFYGMAHLNKLQPGATDGDYAMDVEGGKPEQTEEPALFHRTGNLLSSAAGTAGSARELVCCFLRDLDATPLACPFVVCVNPTESPAQNEFRFSTDSLALQTAAASSRESNENPAPCWICHPREDASRYKTNPDALVHYTATWKNIAQVLRQVKASVFNQVAELKQLE